MRKLYAPCIRLTLAQHRNGSVARAVGQHPSEASPRSGCAIPAQKAVEEEDGTAKISEECDRGPEYSDPRALEEVEGQPEDHHRGSGGQLPAPDQSKPPLVGGPHHK